MNGRLRSFRRVLVALDASGPSLAALEAAAAIAGREMALFGVYVEDVNLLHLAALPCAVEIDSLLGIRRPLAAEAMRQALRAQARRAESALALAAARGRLAHAFRVLRGRVLEELLGAAAEADLLALGATARRRAGLGSIARGIATAAERPVLVLPHGGVWRGRVGVAYTDEESLLPALELALELNDRLGAGAEVLLFAGRLASGTAAAARLAERVGAVRLRPYYEADGLARAVRAEGVRTVVLPATAGDPTARLQGLLDTEAAVLLLRR